MFGNVEPERSGGFGAPRRSGRFAEGDEHGEFGIIGGGKANEGSNSFVGFIMTGDRDLGGAGFAGDTVTFGSGPFGFAFFDSIDHDFSHLAGCGGADDLSDLVRRNIDNSFRLGGTVDEFIDNLWLSENTVIGKTGYSSEHLEGGNGDALAKAGGG